MTPTFRTMAPKMVFTEILTVSDCAESDDSKPISFSKASTDPEQSLSTSLSPGLGHLLS